MVELSCRSAGSSDAFQLRNDPCRQDLAQFDAPLIEGINLPDRSLGENAVFVKRNQLAECLRGQPLCENGIGRTIAFKDAVRYKPLRRTLLP